MTVAAALENRAVRHLLTGPAIAARTERILHREAVERGGLLLEAETMSGVEQLPVRIAYEL